MAFDDRVVFGIRVVQSLQFRGSSSESSVMFLPWAPPVRQEHNSDGFHVSQMATIQNSLCIALVSLFSIEDIAHLAW